MDSQRLTAESQRFNSQRFNLTHGDIMSKLLQVSVPIVGTQLLMMSYNLVDMALLGRLSSDAVAASGSAGMFMWLANGLVLIGRMGAEIGVSQRKGCGDRQGAWEFSHNSLFLAAAFGLAVGLLYIVFAGPLISFLNIQEAHVADDAAGYLRIVGIGLPAAFIAMSVAGTFTGSGNSRAPFLIMAVGLAANAVLDPLFIFTFGLGVRGAAIATIIGQILTCVLSLLWLRRKKDRPFRQYPFFRKPVAARVKTIFGWTVPISVESLLFTFFAMITARYIATYGADAIAVFRVSGQVESLCWLLCLGFSSGVTAFVGQNFGAQRWTRIWECLRKALAAILIWGTFTTILFVFWGGQLFSIFVPDPEIVKMGADALRIFAYSEVFFCVEAIAGGAFRGMGRTFPPSVSSIITNALRVPAAYYVVSRGIGLNGIWWVITLTASMRGLWIFIWFLFYARTRPKADC